MTEPVRHNKTNEAAVGVECSSTLSMKPTVII